MLCCLEGVIFWQLNWVLKATVWQSKYSAMYVDGQTEMVYMIPWQCKATQRFVCLKYCPFLDSDIFIVHIYLYLYVSHICFERKTKHWNVGVRYTIDSCKKGEFVVAIVWTALYMLHFYDKRAERRAIRV